MGVAGGLYYATFAYIDVFLLGGVAGYLTAVNRVPHWFSGGAIGAVLFCLLCLIGYIWPHWSPYTWWTPLLYSALGANIAGLLLWLMANEDSFVVGALRVAPLRILGRLSYGIYLWHGIVLALLMPRLSGRGVHFSMSPETFEFWRTLYVLLVITAVASVSYGLIERPFLVLRRRTAGGHMSPPVPWVTTLATCLAAIGAFELVFWS